MKVAIMYSGGKDSNFAIAHAKEKGWDIQYLLSVKPTRTDCFLFHFATVEHTVTQAGMMNMPHEVLSCDVADPEAEAELVRAHIEQKQKETPVDAILLGGTGLQETQLKSLQLALGALGIEVFATEAGEEHDEVIDRMLEAGMEIMITQVASDGLMPWLGKVLTNENWPALKADSIKYKFHVGFEGGYADTFVINAPWFPKKINVEDFSIVKEDQYCGHVVINKLSLVEKEVSKEH